MLRAQTPGPGTLEEERSVSGLLGEGGGRVEEAWEVGGEGTHQGSRVCSRVCSSSSNS